MSRPGFRMRPADVGGVRGWYEAAGAGPPAVVLASPIALARSYRPTLRALAPWFRAYAVAMPGSDRGARLDRPWGVAEYADWAAGFVRHLGLDRPTVVGHSHTGAVAVALAARHPAAVGRLVIADGCGACPDSFWRALAARFADACHEVELATGAWHHIVWNAVFHTRNYVHATRVALAADVRPLADRVTVPTLLAWGARDHTVPPDRAARFAARLPDPTLYLSKAGSHEWLIDRADEFAAVLRRFVQPG